MTAGAKDALLLSLELTRLVKTRISKMVRSRLALAILAAFLLGLDAACAADFTITSPGFFYATNGQGANPTITLVRGRTYTFAISTSGSHPFFIGASVGGAAVTGISGQNAAGNSSGTITFDVPTNAVDCVYYCFFHHFSGNIVMIDPPPTPPIPRIIGFSFGDDIVLRSSPATNTFAIIPEFKTNLNDTNWETLTVLSNRFSNGTNETFCGRPPGTNVFIRVRAQ